MAWRERVTRRRSVEGCTHDEECRTMQLRRLGRPSACMGRAGQSAENSMDDDGPSRIDNREARGKFLHGALYSSTQSVSFVIELCFLQGIDGVPHEAFELLNLRLALRDGRIQSHPLSNDSPRCPIFVQ